MAQNPQAGRGGISCPLSMSGRLYRIQVRIKSVTGALALYRFKDVF